MTQRATTIRLPEALYERLRRVAFDLRIPRNTIAVTAIEERVTSLEAAVKDAHADRDNSAI